MRFLLPTLLLALWAIALSVVLVQAIGRMGESYSGEIKSYDDCQFYVGKEQKLLIYAQDHDLCGALMALPSGSTVTLQW